MQRTVVFILGTSFSGSSLLNSMLDVQPASRGLGEAVHLLRKPTNAWCGHCKCHVDACRLQEQIDPRRFYESVFDVYEESDVLVNSSKHWGQCFRYMPIPPSPYRLCVIVLSKSMEEFAYSFSAHQSCSFEESFDVWLDFYTHLFRNLDGVLHQSPSTDVQQRLISRIREPDLAYVSYQELALRPEATIERLCHQLELPFDPGFRDRLFRGDTCTIGGNNAIYAQRSGNEAFFDPQRDYLNGKYAGRHGRVFYDDLWDKDRELKRVAEQYRESMTDALEAMEQRLRHRPQPTCGNPSHP